MVIAARLALRQSAAPAKTRDLGRKSITSKVVRIWPLLVAAACAPATAPGPPTAPAPVHDVLIRGGRVLDGTGSPWFRADIAVQGDRIAAVGLLPGAIARDTVDATGLIVAPGFIDMLGHSHYMLLQDGRAISKITQGITTEIVGEVSSVAPVNERTLAELDSDERALVTWRDFTGYFEALEEAGIAINVASFVTAGTVRRHVMGDANRAPSAAELAAMKALVAEAMQQGAVGLSTGMIYAPASYASTEEIAGLARVAAAYGGGYASHIRSEGVRLVEAIEEAIRIGELAGTWTHIHHLKASGKKNWGKMAQAVATIEAARNRGLDVTADQYPYAASGTDLDAIIPGWAHAGGVDSLVARLRDPQIRARLREEIAPGDSIEYVGESSGGPGGVMLAGFATDSLRRYTGMRLDEAARVRGQHVVEALFDLLIADHAGISAIYFSMSEDDIALAMRQPWVSFGTDAGARAADSTVVGLPHPRGYGTFPRILCRYVRERGVLELPDAVRRMTSLGASRVGLHDRGLLRRGMMADIIVFDPETVCDRATFQEPVQTSVGIRHVLVNGSAVLVDGLPTGKLPGRALRH